MTQVISGVSSSVDAEGFLPRDPQGNSEWAHMPSIQGLCSIICSLSLSLSHTSPSIPLMSGNGWGQPMLRSQNSTLFTRLHSP